MPSTEETSPRARSSWAVPNTALLVLAVVLGLLSVFFATRAEPATEDAAAYSARHTAVDEAARREVLAFLTLDHRRMDRTVQRVLDGATGDFARQYSRGRAGLVASSRRSRAVSTGHVRRVGVSDRGADEAVALVAADAQVTNRSTGGQAQRRFFRLQLTLVRQDDRWLTSDLRFVG